MTEEQRQAEDAFAEWSVQLSYDESVTNGKPIDWRYWVLNRQGLTAAQAARLMCGLDPHLHESLDSRPFKNDPRNNLAPRCERARLIEDSAIDHGLSSATPAQWFAWAKGLSLIIDDRFTLAVSELKPAPATEGVHDAPVVKSEQLPAIRKEGYVLKKAAAIKKYSDTWPTIETDISHANENGLSEAAKAPIHGEWYETALLAWADRKGKRDAPKKEHEGVNSVFNLAGIKHTLKG